MIRSFALTGTGGGTGCPPWQAAVDSRRRRSKARFRADPISQLYEQFGAVEGR